MRQILSLVLLSLGLSSVARADLMLEPYLGYEMGTLTASASGASDQTNNSKGVVPGLRLGYLAPALVWVALDYSMETSGKVSASGSSTDIDSDQSHLYLDVGINLPILLRVWGGYGFTNTFNFKPTGSTTTYSGGSQVKLGVGFTGLPFVSLNLEYVTGNFSTYPTGLSGAKYATTIVSVSLPLDL